MSYRRPARTAARRTRSTFLAAHIAVSAALVGVLVHQSLPSSPSTAASPPLATTAADIPLPGADRAWGQRPPHPPRDHRGPRGAADGVVPDGATVFADDLAGVANLDAALLGALRQAATDAAGDGVRFSVTSGWRSRQYQEQLLREAIAEYGSEEEAARWVATADTSAHVSGNAVDIGHADAMAWLSEHGAEYGLCQIYRNEPWHFELRPDAIGAGCPPLYADPTHDPRMQP